NRATISDLLKSASTPPVLVSSRKVASVESINILYVGATIQPRLVAGILRHSRQTDLVLPEPAPPTKSLKGALLLEKCDWGSVAVECLRRIVFGTRDSWYAKFHLD